MTELLQDFRYALRTFRRGSGLTLIIVLSLAIGIGANSAIFSVVNALLLRPLPYPDPDRLAILWLRSPGINIPQDRRRIQRPRPAPSCARSTRSTRLCLFTTSVPCRTA